MFSEETYIKKKSTCSVWDLWALMRTCLAATLEPAASSFEAADHQLIKLSCKQTVAYLHVQQTRSKQTIY